MPLVDAHVHLRTGKLSGTLRPASVELALSLLQEDMEQAGVATSLVVTYPEDIPTLAREASRFPGRLYSLLWFDSRRPERSLLPCSLASKRSFRTFLKACCSGSFSRCMRCVRSASFPFNFTAAVVPLWRCSVIRIYLPRSPAPFPD